MSLDSMKEIFDRMEAEHKPFWEIVLETDMDERQVTRQQSMAKMLTTWQYMVDAADTYTGRGPCPAATSARSLPRPCPWRNPTPACAAS